jgi:hypothetical protein
MSKTYFCNKIIEDKVCGETNSENFEKGRYTLCKECKKRESYKSIKKKRDKEKEIKLEQIKPEFDASEMAKDTFFRIPIKNGETINQNIESLTRSINKIKVDQNDYINIMNLNISLFQKSQNDLRKKYDDLKIKYDELMNYCMSTNAYVRQMNDSKSGPFIPESII